MNMTLQSFLSLGPDGFHRIAYTDSGDAANRHAVLCVHGLSRNSLDFDRLAIALANDCRVVCMDVVGRGDSDWLQDKSGYCFPTYLGDAAALIARVTMPPRKRLMDDLRAPLPIPTKSRQFANFCSPWRSRKHTLRQRRTCAPSFRARRTGALQSASPPRSPQPDDRKDSPACRCSRGRAESAPAPASRPPPPADGGQSPSQCRRWHG